MKNKIPAYFYSKHNSLWLVIGTAVFTELFIIIFEPFRAGVLVDNDWQYLLWTTVVVVLGMVVICLSRWIMHVYASRRELSVTGYSIWIFLEVNVMTFIYSVLMMEAFPSLADEYQWSFFPLYKDVLLGTAFTLFIPYTILLLAFAYIDAKNELQSVTGNEGGVRESEMYHFYDERGELKLSIRPEMVYYLESADNYVMIYYINGTKLDKMMIRNTLKNIEWRFLDKGLVRCHRSFIINIKKVSVIRRQESEVVVDFADGRVPTIPVSRGYSEQVMNKFSIH